MGRLDGKIAIVTGSSSGIGKAIALRFAEEGARLVLAARRLQLLEQLASCIRERGGEALTVQTDVRDEPQVERLITGAIQHFGRLDILVNNGVIGGGGRLGDTRTERFDDVINTNLRGTFFCCRAGFRHMKKAGGGVWI